MLQPWPPQPCKPEMASAQRYSHMFFPFCGCLIAVKHVHRQCSCLLLLLGRPVLIISMLSYSGT